MALNDIVQLKTRTTVHGVTGYTFLYMQEGSDWSTFWGLAAAPGLWYFNSPFPMAPGGTPRPVMTLFAKWVWGVDVGREEVLGTYTVPGAFSQQISQWWMNTCPLVVMSGTAASGRLIEKRYYPFNLHFLSPIVYYPENGAGGFTALNDLADKFTQIWFTEGVLPNVGRWAVWSQKFEEWALVTDASVKPYPTTQPRRRQNRPT